MFGDSETINRLAEVLASIQVSVAGVEDDLGASVSGLIPAYWHGAAASAFQGHWVGEQSSITALIRGCGRMARVLEHLASELQRANSLAEQAQAAVEASGMVIDSDGRLLPSDPFLAARIGVPGVDGAAVAHATALMDQARQIARAAQNEALAELSALDMPQIDPSLTVDDAKNWVDQEVPGADHRSFWQKLWGDGGSDLRDVVGGGLAMLGGDGLIALGAGGEMGGVALDATGVGALVGVPVNVFSAGVIVTGGAVAIGGAALAGYGLGDLVAMASGPKSGRLGTTGGKAGATDIPSWAKGTSPGEGETGTDYAKRLMDEKYGEGNYPTGPRSEYNKLKKYGDRHFRPR